MIKATMIALARGLCSLAVLTLPLAVIAQPAPVEEPGFPTAAERFSREELAQMLGPVALYPDKLLSQILMASTYPIEVIEADRWVRRNPGAQGDSLEGALLDKEWDPSVKALCHFPAILALMSERISETTKLGNAFLVQEAELMDMVQELRAKAYAQGNLNSTPEQKVIVENETVIIEPANPRVVYVPYYDPFYIYGPWWYPAYLPHYWGPPGVRAGVGISFWPGVYFGFSFGDWCDFDWHHHYIYFHGHERPRYVRHDRWQAESGPWHHSPVHRRGVAYRDKNTAARYGQYPQRPAAFQGDVRGFPEGRESDREGGRRGGERISVDRDRRLDDNSRYQGARHEQQRLEQEIRKRQQQMLEPAERDRQPRQEPPTLEGVSREQRGVERELQRREQQPREPIDRDRQHRQERPRLENGSPEPPRVEQAQRERSRTERVDQERRGRESVERERLRKDRETVFEQRQNGRSERQSSERGRFSRQHRSDGYHDRGRPGDTRDGREGGVRGRR